MSELFSGPPAIRCVEKKTAEMISAAEAEMNALNEKAANAATKKKTAKMIAAAKKSLATMIFREKEDAMCRATMEEEIRMDLADSLTDKEWTRLLKSLECGEVKPSDLRFTNQMEMEMFVWEWKMLVNGMVF